MRAIACFIMFFVLSSTASSQYRILYDLDSYARVDIKFRTTIVSPDANASYENVLNNSPTDKKYWLNIGGSFTDNLLVNSATNQKTRYNSYSGSVFSGTNSDIFFRQIHRSSDRFYKGNRYVNHGFEVSSIISYDKDQGGFERFNTNVNAQFNLGFGFGRIEVINNAWLGSRILEELSKGNLLKSEPDAQDMKLFFDLIGDLENERVLDPRLKIIYQIENIIQFVEDKGWIEDGSIRSFAIIYDAFQFEDFLIRRSGKRLEFMMQPFIDGYYEWANSTIFTTDRLLRPGFKGCIEYTSYSNGDLEYYTRTTIGASIFHDEYIRKDAPRLYRTLEGNMYYSYRYRYIPSLRTNLMFYARLAGGFNYVEGGNSINPRISFTGIMEYNYYFSPSTQLVMNASLRYDDFGFQVGDFQPRIRGNFSVDIVHAIR